MRRVLGAETLRSDFISYKRDGTVPDRFGRDAPLNDPPSAKLSEIQHIHLRRRFSKWEGKRRYNRTSDTWLVYTQGFTDPECYYLIAILKNDAHGRARRTQLMMSLMRTATITS